MSSSTPTRCHRFATKPSTPIGRAWRSRSRGMNGSRNVRTAGYKEQLGPLPEVIQELAEAAFALFVEDPNLHL